MHTWFSQKTKKQFVSFIILYTTLVVGVCRKLGKIPGLIYFVIKNGANCIKWLCLHCTGTSTAEIHAWDVGLGNHILWKHSRTVYWTRLLNQSAELTVEPLIIPYIYIGVHRIQITPWQHNQVFSQSLIFHACSKRRHAGNAYYTMISVNTIVMNSFGRRGPRDEVWVKYVVWWQNVLK